MTVTIDSLGIKKEEIFGNITHAIVDEYKKIIKIFHGKISILNRLHKFFDLNNGRLNILESYHIKDKIDYLKDYCFKYEELIKCFMKFVNDNNLLYKNVYKYNFLIKRT